MCGIWCAIGFEMGTLPLERMAHRGPDANGRRVLNVRGATVELGHRRLSIIDLDPRSNQPMAWDSGNLHIVYNGEIYNYRELRAELETLGRTFQTMSDTEVLLAAYAVWGLDAFK